MFILLFFDFWHSSFINMACLNCWDCQWERRKVETPFGKWLVTMMALKFPGQARLSQPVRALAIQPWLITWVQCLLSIWTDSTNLSSDLHMYSSLTYIMFKTHSLTHTKYTFTHLCTHILHTQWHTLTHVYTHKPHTAHTLAHVHTCTHTHTDTQHPHIRISKHIHTHLKFLLMGTYRILQLPFQLKLVLHKSYQ